MEHSVAKDDDKADERLPTISSFAFYLQKFNNKLISEALEDADIIDVDETEEEKEKRDDERIAKEFVLGQMLKLASKFDYADEQGRTLMMQLIRELFLSQIQCILISCFFSGNVGTDYHPA